MGRVELSVLIVLLVPKLQLGNGIVTKALLLIKKTKEQWSRKLGLGNERDAGGIMRSRYKIMENRNLYFITSTIIEWIPVFTKREYCDIIVQSLSYCRQNKGLRLFAYVIMPDHVHAVASSDNLSAIMKDFKSYTAKEILRTAEADAKKWLLNQFVYYKKLYKQDSEHQVWQEGFHPQVIEKDDILRQKVEYIHNNPVRRGLVEVAEHWIYSSARNYLYSKGCIEIDQIEI